MKYLYLFALISLVACNNSDEKAPGPTGSSKEETLQEAIRQYPDSALLKENLVQYYREGGNYDKAISTVAAQLQKDSLNARWWDIQATLYYENGDTMKSIRSFENAVRIYPDPAYIISLGTLYAQTRDPQALAIGDALLLGSKANADKEAYFIKGLYYAYIGSPEKAIPFYDKCIALNYSFMDAYREKAIALYDMKRYLDALQVLDKALTLQNNFDEGYYYRGRCLEKLGKPLEAIEAYQMALLYDPEYAEAKEALANLGVKK
ncbi:MAG: hypothetical protein JWQ27_709 [Ferruginibacter sp.]|nr:hypothetical protein [Ferruginibacter sp.]